MPSTIVKVGTARSRSAVVVSGMIGGGLSDALTDDVDASVAMGVIRAVCNIFLRRLNDDDVIVCIS